MNNNTPAILALNKVKEYLYAIEKDDPLFQQDQQPSDYRNECRASVMILPKFNSVTVITPVIILQQVISSILTDNNQLNTPYFKDILNTLCHLAKIRKDIEYRNTIEITIVKDGLIFDIKGMRMIKFLSDHIKYNDEKFSSCESFYNEKLLPMFIRMFEIDFHLEKDSIPEITEEYLLLHEAMYI